MGERRLSARAGAIISSRKWPRVILKSLADIPSEAGQADFSADVVKLKAANADVIFVYLHEEESARFLKETGSKACKTPLDR